jgi:ubiquitin-protein ligase
MSAIKRMHHDIRDFMRSTTLKDQGIFCIFDEEDVFRVRAMIVGPEDTPYFGGYFFLI